MTTVQSAPEQRQLLCTVCEKEFELTAARTVSLTTMPPHIALRGKEAAAVLREGKICGGPRHAKVQDELSLVSYTP